MSSFCFILTERCNWNCSYCEFPTIENPNDTTIEILSKHLPYIKEIFMKIEPHIVFSDISGGEIGLLPIETIRYFFEIMDFPMVISTNGKFMENNYHQDPILKPYIKAIWHHVHPEPKGFRMEKDYEDSEIYINKGIVHNNINEMVDFIKVNNHIDFGYIELEYDINEPRQMNSEIYIELHERIKDLPNITKEAKLHLLERTTEAPNKREYCTKFNTTVVLDLVNEKILLCHRSQMNSIQLTKENLITRIAEHPKNIFSTPNKCESCTRLYYGKMIGMNVEDFYKTRRLLCQ